MSHHPTVRLQPGRDKRARAGHPWIFSNEVMMDAEAKALGPGTVVTLKRADGRPLGTAFFNPHSLIAARLLASAADVTVDADFLAERLRHALALRQLLYRRPFYRLVHAEADGLPGLVIDRYGDVLACQVNAAGMERLLDPLCEALTAVLAPRAIVLRNDSAVRSLEGLDRYVRVARGELDGPVEIEENGVRFLADLSAGQKTGWFFDQRDSRAFVAGLSAGRRLLDLYSYTGGFALQAVAAGAASAMAVDRSDDALALARSAAGLNGVEERCTFVRAEVFAEIARLEQGEERFDIVIADPPAFVKSKKDLAAGTKGYVKLARLAAGLVRRDGFLFIASCSHHMDPAGFADAVRRGLIDAGRTGRILRRAGAAADHPTHPALPESAYLKTMLLQLD